MPLAFTSAPATVGEASRPLAAPFWAGAPRTPTKSDADADADYIGGAGRSPSSLSPIPEEPHARRPREAARERAGPVGRGLLQGSEILTEEAVGVGRSAKVERRRCGVS